jgi:scyllo-inositol 2-dehydrogenase (NADP+)
MTAAKTRTDRDLRVALIGYGLAGSVFHAPLIATTRGLRLAAIVTANDERRAQATRDFPAASLLADADALWRAAADFDLVVIASPNRFHAPLAQAALAAGLHVVIDKPFATSVAEGEALIAAATRAGRMLTVFQNRRWDGDFLTLRALLERGELGRVQRFESRFERWRPSPKPGWRQNAAPGDAGGVLFDLGSHLIDQALQLFGPVRTIHAERRRRHPAAVVDDDSFVALSHASGVDSHLWMSSIAAHAGPRFRVLGSSAAYVKHGLDPQEDALRNGERPIDAGWGKEAEAHWGEIVSGATRRPVTTLAGDYPAFYAGVLRSVRDGAPAPVDARDCLEALRVIERALPAGSGAD